MLSISDFYTTTSKGMVFSEEQASDFAKGVAGDFNPIHDVGARRFCVPGDLLFAALLDRYGVYQHLHADLMALVSADVEVSLPQQLEAKNDFRDTNDRHLLSLAATGEKTTDPTFVSSLVQQYVQFSGKTFPDILVGLMQDNNVMINPARPLVIYKELSLQLDRLNAPEPRLVDAGSTLEVDGKKGRACLRYEIQSENEQIGKGQKIMLLSGLREFDETAMTAIINEYNVWREAYKTSA